MATTEVAAQQQQDTVKDIKAIKQLIVNYENAWNRHDAKWGISVEVLLVQPQLFQYGV